MRPTPAESDELARARLDGVWHACAVELRVDVQQSDEFVDASETACEKDDGAACLDLAYVVDARCARTKRNATAEELALRACDLGNVDGCLLHAQLCRRRGQHCGKGPAVSEAQAVQQARKVCVSDANVSPRSCPRSRIEREFCLAGADGMCDRLQAWHDASAFDLRKDKHAVQNLLAEGCERGHEVACTRLAERATHLGTAGAVAEILLSACAPSAGKSFGCDGAHIVADAYSEGWLEVKQDVARSDHMKQRLCKQGDGWSCEKVRSPGDQNE